MTTCPICDSKDVQPFHHVMRSPILQNVLYASRDEARAARRVDAPFHYCPACHFVFNPEFQEDSVRYDPGYDNNQLASPTYRQHVETITDTLIADCRLDESSAILEIGCGSGFFLSRLKAKSVARRIVGYDPSYDGQHGMQEHVRRELYRWRGGESFDLVVMRHTLEGLLRYDAVFPDVVSALGSRGKLYIEAADLDYIVERDNPFILYHEYARYYSVTALVALLGKYGLQARNVFKSLGGNFISMLATCPRPAPGFRALDRLRDALEKSDRAVVWGIGGRAISFLTQLAPLADRVLCGVDIDERKQGRYIPVTGQKIVSPEEAVRLEPDLVIVANANYLEEIRAHFGPRTNFLTLEGSFYGSGGQVPTGSRSTHSGER